MLRMQLQASDGNADLGHLVSQLGSECTIGRSGGEACLEGGHIVVKFPEPLQAPSWNQEHPRAAQGIENTMQRIETWALRHKLVRVVNSDSKEVNQ